MNIFIKFIQTCILCFVGAFFCYFSWDKYNYVFSEQAFINSKFITIRAPIAGEVEFLIKDTDFAVEKNQKLIKITNHRYGDTESSTQYNYSQNEIDLLEDEIVKNNILLEQNKTNLERFRILKECGSATLKEFEDKENEFKILSAGLENKKSRLEHLKKRMNLMQEQLSLQKETIITAPIDGTVWTFLSKDGEHIEKAEELLQIADPQNIWIDAFFPERDAKYLYPGMEVSVYKLGKMKEKYQGTIAFVRGGSGRVAYDSAVEVPAETLAKKLVGVRILIASEKIYSAKEFYGIGRSMIIKFKKRS